MWGRRGFPVQLLCPFPYLNHVGTVLTVHFQQQRKYESQKDIIDAAEMAESEYVESEQCLIPAQVNNKPTVFVLLTSCLSLNSSVWFQKDERR